MGDFSWLQFSDLHFRARDQYDTLLMRKALLDCLGRESFACDYVFITGDIADKCDFENADKHMADILSRIDVVPGNVFWAVGNHDIKRGAKLRKTVIAGIRRRAAEPSLGAKEAMSFEEAMDDDEIHSLLTYTGMASYIKEYERLFGRKLSLTKGTHYTKPRKGIETPNRISIFLLRSRGLRNHLTPQGD
jgi:hypothetical protein